MKDRVDAWMSRKVVSTGPGEPLYAAVELLAEHGIRHVLVLDDEELVGVISNRDIIRATLRNSLGKLDLHQSRVEEVMTPGPLACTEPAATLGVAAELMVAKKVNALPVLEGEKVVGVLTSDDILSAVPCWERRPRPDV